MSRVKGRPPLSPLRVEWRRTYENGYHLGWKVTCPVHGEFIVGTGRQQLDWELAAHEWCGRHRPGATPKSR